MNDKPPLFPLVERIEGDAIEGAAAVFRVAFTKAQLETFTFGFPPEVALREYIAALVADSTEEGESWHPRI